MERLYTSRKLWGGLLGSISIIVLAMVADKESVITGITAIGSLWTAAIVGQGVSDGIKSNKQKNGNI
jgi:hypothetical protein